MVSGGSRTWGAVGEHWKQGRRWLQMALACRQMQQDQFQLQVFFNETPFGLKYHFFCQNIGKSKFPLSWGTVWQEGVVLFFPLILCNEILYNWIFLKSLFCYAFPRKAASHAAALKEELNWCWRCMDHCMLTRLSLEDFRWRAGWVHCLLMHWHKLPHSKALEQTCLAVKSPVFLRRVFPIR